MSALGGVLVALVCMFTLSTIANAQWRIATPRDTVHVPANNPTAIYSSLQLTSPIAVSMEITGTFGLWAGQDSTGFDARYTYNIPNWLAPYPLADPPTFNGTNYQIYLAIDTNRLGESVIRVNEPYQTSHRYTARYTSTGVPFKFRIKDRLNERPDGFYYGTGTGGLTVNLARFTPGLATQLDKVEFGTVLIGFAASLPDSIESYGVDALMVDSVRIVGSSDFSFLSQRGDHFTLPSENTNEFMIRFAPSEKTDADADLHIYSHNADGPNRHRIIHLHGIGGAPSIAIGPHRIDFGQVRINTTVSSYTNVYNGGNANLYLFGNPINPIISPFSEVPVITSSTQITVSPTSSFQMKTSFTPTARQKYAATLFVQAQNVPLDSVVITGEGVEPMPILSTTSLSFGNVRRGDKITETFRLTNTGNMTATVVNATLAGPNAAAYQWSPSLSTFLLDPDSSIVFTVTFAPGTGPEGQRQAWIELDFDDKTAQYVNLSGYEIEPKIQLGTDLLDFGKVQVNLTSQKAVSIHNNGNVILPLTTTPYIIRLDAPFLLTSSPTTLTPFQTDSLRVEFTPHTHGPAAAWLHTIVNGQFDSVYLVGFGALALPVLSQDTLDFGIHPAGIPATLFTMLRDTGDFPLHIAHLEIIGPNQNDFTLTPSTPQSAFVVPDGRDTALAVTFVTNVKTGLVHTATLKITYTDSTSSTVVLLGREQSQYVQFAQSIIDFGKVRVKKTAALPAVFSNGSDVVLHVGTILISQTGSAYKTGDTNSTVRARDTSNVAIFFTPPVRGLFTGYLHARDGDIRPDSVLLTGIGAAPIPQYSTKLVDCGLVPRPGSGSKQFTLTNAGDWYLTTHYAIVNDPYNEFSVVSSSGSTSYDSLSLAGSASYTVTFKPVVSRLLHTANLVFTYDDNTMDTVVLRGSDDYRKLTFDSAAIHFGQVRINTTATHVMSLINTSSGTLTAQNVTLAPSQPPFSVDALGTLTVTSRSERRMNVTFAPVAHGLFSAQILASGGDIDPDTVSITGYGVAPIPKLAQAVLDFGSFFVGSGGTQSTMLYNIGDYDLNVTGVMLSGPNAADFDVSAVPPTFTVHAGDSLSLSSIFLATTPLQAAPRTATLTFTLDDKSTFTLGLTELDKGPTATQIAFLNFLARPGDFVHEQLVLRTPIAASAAVHELSGTFSFDTTVARMLTIEKGGLTSDPNWTLTTTISHTGKMESVTYDLRNPSDILTTPGVLLRSKFQVNPNATIGGKTTLQHSAFQFFNTNQIAPQTLSGVIVVDSTCGNTHLDAGSTDGTFVHQNNPNPATGSTSIGFDIGFDNTDVTIRVLDITGNEVARPIDHTSFAQGRYAVTLSTERIPAGVYFYEFTAGANKPEMKKMIVGK